MTMKVAVAVVNPVNGFGLFQYLETFYENEIPFRTFAVSESISVKTNSGLRLQADDVIAALKEHEKDYDAFVFACGDAMKHFVAEVSEPFNQDLLAVINTFDAQKKPIIGHCAAAVLFEFAGIGTGKRVAVHPFGKPHLSKTIPGDDPKAVDGNLFTAQTEHAIGALMPDVLETLKKKPKK